MKGSGGGPYLRKAWGEKESLYTTARERGRGGFRTKESSEKKKTQLKEGGLKIRKRKKASF